MHLFANDEQDRAVHGTHGIRTASKTYMSTTTSHKSARDLRGSSIRSVFTIVAEPPPTCEILNTTCQQGIAKWQGALQRFNR